MTTKPLPAALREQTLTFTNEFWKTLTSELKSEFLENPTIEKDHGIQLATSLTIRTMTSSLASIVSTWASAISHHEKYLTANMTSVLVNETLLKAIELNERMDGQLK